MASLEEEIKQSKFQDEYQKAVLNLLFTGNWLSSIHKKFFDNYDLSMEQYNVLRILRGQHPRPCSIQTINERMLDKMSNVSRLVEKLRIKALIKRTTAKSDRRQVDVSISEKGLALLKNIDADIKNLQERFKTLTEAEAKSLNLLLDKMRD